VSRRIVQYWDTDERPDYIDELIGSFRERNPGWEHLTFTESEAAAFIGRHFDSRALAAFSACAVPAMQADYFRYCAVGVLGGVYADADLECRSSLEPLIDKTTAGRLFRRPNGIVVNGFFVFRSAGHPLLRLALDVATAQIESRAAENVWVATGPGIFTLLHMLHEAGSADDFIARAYDSPLIDGRAFGHSARLVCEVVGDPRTVDEAFDGLTVSSADTSLRWVAVEQHPLRYKQTGAHWLNFEGSIFR
jgi:mannosyltransferase OCH1-like enzyme